MNNETLKIKELFLNQTRLRKLFQLEKEKRGVKNERPVFLSMANIASHHWCAKQSYLKSKAIEETMFLSYLQDRLFYSFMLEHIDTLPRSNNKLLEIGDEIVFDDIEILLKRIAKKIQHRSKKSSGVAIKVNLNSLDTFKRGIILEKKAERHPTIRWNFDWNDYIVIGVPDGITSSFVYEFKTTRTRSLLTHLKPNAFTQADLYGFFFKRKDKKIQIYILDEEKMETWENKVDKSNALYALTSFKEIDDGWTPLISETWKCKSCHYKDCC